MNIYKELMEYVNSIYPFDDYFPLDEKHPVAKIYRELLSPYEAGFLTKLTDKYVSPAEFAAENHIEDETAERILQTLGDKGVAFSKEINGILNYKLMRYFPDLADAVIAKGINSNISKYMQEYLDVLDRSTGSRRELTVNKKIDFNIYHLTYDEVMLYLDQTDSYSLCDCLCRHLNALNNNACGHPIKDMCIQTGTHADYFVRTGRARRVSRDEVEKVLKQAEECGLYHEVFLYDTSNANLFICNCCPCGCISMSLSGRISMALGEGDKPALNVDVQKCIGCRECISNCPGQVLDWSTELNRPVLKDSSCFACGMCEAVCRQGAIQLK